MTPYEEIYKAFLSRILEDEWAQWMVEEAEADWQTILDNAITHFKFPRVSLERNEEGFVEKIGNEEIQIIADFMKCEWLNRCLMTWENIKPMYTERDFSQANLIDKLSNLLEKQEKKALQRESNYYRSIKGKPFKYRKLAGDENGA